MCLIDTSMIHPKYFKEYYKNQDSLLSKKLIIIQNHITHYESIEELLGLQLYLSDKFMTFLQSRKHKEFKNHHAQLSTHLLFSYNIQSIKTAFDALECDFIHSASSVLRTVYESIPKMYYIALNPDKTEEIRVHEEIHSLPYDDAIKELETKIMQEILNGKNLSFLNKKEFNTWLRKKYTPAWFRDQIYSDDHKKLITKLYSSFSKSVHPTTSRNSISTNYTRENTDMFFEFMINLSYFNILAYVEGNYWFLDKLGLIKEIKHTLNKTALNFKTIRADLYMYPNKEGLESKLHFKRTVK